MKDSSNTLSLTFDEFCHIRNVITRAELETLLFDEKLYAEVAQGKVRRRRKEIFWFFSFWKWKFSFQLCFTCRKVHFNLLTFTFGVQCNVCKQKVCRSCITQVCRGCSSWFFESILFVFHSDRRTQRTIPQYFCSNIFEESRFNRTILFFR